jgi:hypothetical protein
MYFLFQAVRGRNTSANNRSKGVSMRASVVSAIVLAVIGSSNFSSAQSDIGCPARAAEYYSQLLNIYLNAQNDLMEAGFQSDEALACEAATTMYEVAETLVEMERACPNLGGTVGYSARRILADARQKVRSHCGG